MYSLTDIWCGALFWVGAGLLMGWMALFLICVLLTANQWFDAKVDLEFLKQIAGILGFMLLLSLFLLGFGSMSGCVFTSNSRAAQVSVR